MGQMFLYPVANDTAGCIETFLSTVYGQNQTP